MEKKNKVRNKTSRCFNILLPRVHPCSPPAAKHLQLVLVQLCAASDSSEPGDGCMTSVGVRTRLQATLEQP